MLEESVFVTKLTIIMLPFRTHLMNLHNVDVNVSAHESQPVIYSPCAHPGGAAHAYMLVVVAAAVSPLMSK